MEITVDVQQFADLIPRLAKATGKSLSDIVKQQAKLLVRGSGEGRDEGLVAYTPPFEDKGGQKLGKALVERDIRRVFLTAATAKQILKRSGVRGASVALTRYLKANQIQKAISLLNGTMDKRVRAKGYTRQQGGKSVRVKSYSQTRAISVDLRNPRLGKINSVDKRPNPGVHKGRQRGDRTSVIGKQWSQLVTDNGSLAAYIKQKQRNVGILKAGWRPAADALGVTLPTYVKNAPRADGNCSLQLESDNPSVTLTNSARTITRGINSLMERALRGRRIRMQADIERKLAALAENGGK